jgi:SAM-dependent methyltransferase
MSTWDGDEYQARFDRLAATGQDVHGEATFVQAFDPSTVLDAGCGTGRVGIELARRGIEVVGVDVDPSMLAAARARGPEIEWVEADLTSFDLGRTFDVVVLAGNVPLFTPEGTQGALVACCAAHVALAGLLIAGFSTDRGYGIDDWDRDATDAGLELVDRFATWAGAPHAGQHYAVSVHRRRGR